MVNQKQTKQQKFFNLLINAPTYYFLLSDLTNWLTKMAIFYIVRTIKETVDTMKTTRFKEIDV